MREGEKEKWMIGESTLLRGGKRGREKRCKKLMEKERENEEIK